MKDKNDSDSRSIMATNKASWADARAGRVVSSLRSELTRTKSAVPVIERDATLGGKVFADYQRPPNPLLFHLDREQLCAGDHVVLRHARVSIARDERVTIEGANGSGKTTLLKALVASSARPEKLLYLPQELEAAAVSALGERIHGFGKAERGHVLAIFAALGSDPERIVQGQSQHLSPGEARKLALAEALARSVWALVLDEPTNHLDLPSIERLEALLEGYPGCVVLVSHDQAFARRVTQRAIQLDAGRVL